jgi:hypothetical protein
MATYEIETVYYTNGGGIKSKEFELFDNKNKAVKHMRSKLSNQNELIKQGDVKDGIVKLVDDRGMLKQVIKFGEVN